MVAPSNKEILSWDKKVDLAEVVLPYSKISWNRNSFIYAIFLKAYIFKVNINAFRQFREINDLFQNRFIFSFSWNRISSRRLTVFVNSRKKNRQKQSTTFFPHHYRNVNETALFFCEIIWSYLNSNNFFIFVELLKLQMQILLTK